MLKIQVIFVSTGSNALIAINYMIQLIGSWTGELQLYNVSRREFNRTSGLQLMCGQPYTLFHSAKPAPSCDDAVTRREGVRLALHVRTTAAWRIAVEVWL